MKYFLLAICVVGFFFPAAARRLQPGFNKQEYLEMLSISAKQIDAAFYRNIPEPKRFKMAYRSAVMGLDNRWDLWVSPDSVAVISIRGTRRNGWLENFYAAMVPATGQLTLSPDFTFTYKLADNPRAAVHVGWLIGAASLSRTILAKIDSCGKVGIKDYLVAGHSQGGAIAYLLTAHLRNLQKEKKLAQNIRFKTYCSAGPKPGNLYFAYDYESTTAGGWAFNVVNAADWVPETPVSIQTMTDFNPVNPFVNAGSIIKKQPFPKNLVYRIGLNKLKNPTAKASRRYQKYLGNLAARFVKKQLPGLVPPVYAPTSNYARAGTFIILQPTPAYAQQFPDNPANVFTHHLLQPYWFLAQQLTGY